jgi:HSP20 family protein
MAIDMWRNQAGDGVTLRNAMDRLLEQAFVAPFFGEEARRGGQARPAAFPVNVYEDSDAYHVWALLPGADPEKLAVTATGQSLAIEAESGASAPEGWRALWGEWQPTRWRRDLTLPSGGDLDNAEVGYDHGVLRLRLPKPAASRPKTLKVKVGSR